jgi:hypothetical protein
VRKAKSGVIYIKRIILIQREARPNRNAPIGAGLHLFNLVGGRIRR